MARGRSVINVIVPEGRTHFFQQLGYVLATLLLFILLLVTAILAAQRRRGGEATAGVGGVGATAASFYTSLPSTGDQHMDRKSGKWKG